MSEWKHQKLAIKKFAKQESFGLLFDCGTGKTRTAIRIAQEKGMPVLVIAPKNLLLQWRDAILEIAGDQEQIVVLTAAVKMRQWFTKMFARFIDTGAEF